MTFTDDDLKRLRELLAAQVNVFPNLNIPMLKALIARLEAGEVLANELANIHGHGGPGDFYQIRDCLLCKDIKVWHKAAGK